MAIGIIASDQTGICEKSNTMLYQFQPVSTGKGLIVVKDVDDIFKIPMPFYYVCVTN